MPFPESPQVGDTYTQEDTVFTFNGSTWDRTIIGANNNTRYAHGLVTVALLNRIAHLETILEKQFLILD